MLIADLMTYKPASVRTDQTLSAAAQMLWDCDCGALPVVEPGSGRVTGMITDRDICMATWSRGLAPGALTVAEAMSPEVVMCRPHDALRDVEGLMQSRQIRRIPVVDSEQRLVGILSLADIARATTQLPFGASNGDLSSEGLASTLAGICAQNAARPVQPRA